MPTTKAKPKKRKKSGKRQAQLPAGVLTSRQAAAVLGFSKELVNKLARTGKLAHYRAGTHYRFQAEAVEAYRLEQIHNSFHFEDVDRYRDVI